MEFKVFYFLLALLFSCQSLHVLADQLPPHHAVSQERTWAFEKGLKHARDVHRLEREAEAASVKETERRRNALQLRANVGAAGKARPKRPSRDGDALPNEAPLELWELGSYDEDPLPPFSGNKSPLSL